MMSQNGMGRRLGEFAAGSYHNQSVLDNLRPSGNGFGDSDRGRLGLGGKAILPTANGRSAQTHQQRQWLDSPLRTFT